MAAKVFESLGKLGLGLAVAGGVVNSALYNGEWEKLSASSPLCIFFVCVVFLSLSWLLCAFVANGIGGKIAVKPCWAVLYLLRCTRKRIYRALSPGSC